MCCPFLFSKLVLPHPNHLLILNSIEILSCRITSLSYRAPFGTAAIAFYYVSLFVVDLIVTHTQLWETSISHAVLHILYTYKVAQLIACLLFMNFASPRKIKPGIRNSTTRVCAGIDCPTVTWKCRAIDWCCHGLFMLGSLFTSSHRYPIVPLKKKKNS